MLQYGEELFSVGRVLAHHYRMDTGTSVTHLILSPQKCLAKQQYQINVMLRGVDSYIKLTSSTALTSAPALIKISTVEL